MSARLMSEIMEITFGLQCCLRCGRTLTDRALHDMMEEPVIASIRAEHPEWWGEDEHCQPCVEEYRKLLAGRLTRSEAAATSATERGRAPQWLSRLLNRSKTLKTQTVT